MLHPVRCWELVCIACAVVACAGASPQPSVPPAAERAPAVTPQPPARSGAAVLPDCTSCFEDGEEAKAAGDPARAVGLFERGCQQEEAAACDAAARMHAVGEGVPEDDPRAIVLHLRACDLGHGGSCADLGRAMVESATHAEQGRALLTRGCEIGDARSCGYLAISYEKGLGGPSDLAASVRAFGRSCELGSPRACTAHAIAFQTGRGVDEDLSRARELYERGCEGDDPQACGNLGVLLRDGLGGPTDEKRAVQLFERSCAGGETNACVSLGAALFNGEGGLEVDAPRAIELFEAACKEGRQVACDNLAGIAKARATKAEEGKSRWTTRIGSLTIGSGDQTATFKDVQSTCSTIPLTLAFGAAAGDVRSCLSGSAARRVSLAVEGGKLASSSVEPDDAAGRCVANALGRAPLGKLTCAFEASVSR